MKTASMGVTNETPQAPEHTLGWYRDPVLWCALAIGLLLRGALLVLYPYSRLAGDEGLHYVSGVLTSEFGPSSLGHWAPGYELFLAGIFGLAGPDAWNALAIQVAISTAIVATVYGIAYGAAGRRAGRIAAGLTALYPSLIAYSSYFYGETLFLFFLTGAVCALCGSSTAPTTRRLAVAGVLFGLAILTRSLVIWVLPLFALWLVLRARRAEARQVAIVIVIALATVLPWTIRNWVKYDGFLLVDGTMGRTLYLAYSQDETQILFGRDLGYERGTSLQENRVRAEQPTRIVARAEELPPANELVLLFPDVVWKTLIPGWDPKQPMERLLNKLGKARTRATLDLIHRQSSERRAALDFAKSNPMRVLSQSFDRLYAFWGPNSFLLRAIHGRTYRSGPLAASNYAAAKWIVVGAYVSLVALALLALGRRRLAIQVDWGVALIVTLSVLATLSEGSSRYRLPIMPFVIVLASVWLAAPHRPEGRVRLAALGLIGIAFAIFSAHYLATILP